MASLNRPTKSDYIIHDCVTVDTPDNEDHTFSGIMFPIQCKDVLPVNHIVIFGLQVRGGLGPMTVWVTNNENNNDNSKDDNTSEVEVARQSNANNTRYNLRPTIHKPKTTAQFSMSKQNWTKIYEKEHKASFNEYEALDLSDNPIILKPGEVRGIYIHSSIPDDSGIVYDNQQHIKTHDDNFITVLPGRAHVSTKPFGTRPIWGYGNAWRDRREFVGMINYGIVYDLWNPSEHLRFGDGFRDLATTLFACQRRFESPFCRLPDECIFYILNMCHWQWAGDSFDQVLDHKKKIRSKKMLIDAQAAKATEAESDTALTAASMKTDTANDDIQDQSNDVEEGTDSNDEMHDSIEIIEVDEDDNEDDDEDDDDYDEDFGDSEDEEEDDFDYESSFRFYVYDDLDDGSAEEARERQLMEEAMEQRRYWLRHLHVMFGEQAANIDDEDDS